MTGRQKTMSLLATTLALAANPEKMMTNVTIEPPKEQNDRYDRGWLKLAEVDGDAGRQVVEGLKDIAPDLGRYVIEFAFGDLYSRPGLDLRSREIATIAALTVMGTATPQLKVHIHAALNVGVTRDEIIEVMIQMSAYAGFPAAINGVAAAREVFNAT